MTTYKVGDCVRYHGSKVPGHGTYHLVVVPKDQAERGYTLARDRDDGTDRQDVLTNVHPDSFTKVEEAKVATSPTRDDLLALEYDEEYLDGIEEFVPGFLEAIRDGVFDEHIKMIAAACFDRKDALTGKEPGQRVAFLAKTTRVAPTASTYDGPVLGEDGYFLSPVASRTRALEVGGRYYSKEDMVGRHLRLRQHGGLPFYWKDVLVKIRSVGNEYLTVETVENPRDRYPQSSVLKEKNIGVGYALKVSAQQVIHIFGR